MLPEKRVKKREEITPHSSFIFFLKSYDQKLSIQFAE
jgi:hypothetical protein